VTSIRSVVDYQVSCLFNNMVYLLFGRVPTRGREAHLVEKRISAYGTAEVRYRGGPDRYSSCLKSQLLAIEGWRAGEE